MVENIVSMFADKGRIQEIFGQSIAQGEQKLVDSLDPVTVYKVSVVVVGPGIKYTVAVQHIRDTLTGGNVEVGFKFFKQELFKDGDVPIGDDAIPA